MSRTGRVLTLLCLLVAATAQAGQHCPFDPELPIASLPVGTDIGFSVAVPGFEGDPVWGGRSVFAHLPGTLTAGELRPLLVALHGAAGSPGGATVQAARARDLWRESADRGGFFVIAPAASGASGSWVAPITPTDHPSDYDRILAAIDYLARQQPIDPERIYLWGFSAGGHVALDIALNRPHPHLHSEMFAGFAVHAGVSAGLACSGLSSAECAARVFSGAASKRPVSVHIGNSDPLLAFALEDRMRFQNFGWLTGANFFWQLFGGGHTVLAEQPAEVWNQLCAFSTRPAGKLPARPSLDLPTLPTEAESERSVGRASAGDRKRNQRPRLASPAAAD